MFHSTTGLIHLLSAGVAMLAGAIVLLNTKGGRFHQRVGYVYVGAMLVMLLTAFMIYTLFGRFGPFHWLAIFSSLTLAGGIVPMYFRRQIKGWMYWHYYCMNWSVVGLYAAFWAETLTRTLPMQHFWLVVVAATGATAAIGSILIRRHAKRLLPM